MRWPHVIPAGFAVVLLATGCGAAAQQVSNHHPATTGRHSRQAPVQGAEAGKPQTGRSMASQGGQQQGNGILPPMRCSFSGSGAEPNGPLPCGQMLLVRIVLHPRNGPPKIVYVRKPCLCASGD